MKKFKKCKKGTLISNKDINHSKHRHLIASHNMMQEQYLRVYKFYSRKGKNDMHFELKHLPWFHFN